MASQKPIKITVLYQDSSSERYIERETKISTIKTDKNRAILIEAYLKAGYNCVFQDKGV